MLSAAHFPLATPRAPLATRRSPLAAHPCALPVPRSSTQVANVQSKEDESRLLREQLADAHAKGARLQQELRASETELGELHEAYTLVWDELQEQRAAVNSAMSQCVALQRQMDRVNGERSGSRTARSC